MDASTYVQDLVAGTGITIGGHDPWDVRINDDRIVGRVMRHGVLGIGEAYMDGWWDADRLDEALYRVLSANLRDNIRFDVGLIGEAVRGVLFNPQRAHVTEVGERHYDIGNDLYHRMLDKRWIYSCAYWKDAQNLDDAQEAKLDLICRKIGLQPGMKILDIGSGWGGLIKYAAERYGVSAVGITISREQAAWANEHTDGLPIETRLVDYMAMDGTFDRVISVGMFEHVGYKNYRRYMHKARELLAPDGLFLLHTIGGNWASTHGDPWFNKYIFPNGMLPGPSQLALATEKLFVIEDWHSFGAYYDLTLMAWLKNFDAAWPELAEKYGERFRRMWRYYLCASAALFRARQTQLWQVVLSPNGIRGGYTSVR